MIISRLILLRVEHFFTLRRAERDIIDSDILISGFHRTFFKVNHIYWPTNALNCIKLKMLKSTFINIIIQVSNFGTIPYKFDITFHITVQISCCQTPTTHTKHHK